MKPITADNNDGRVLLALRAGEMTPGELAERGLHFPGWLITAGYVARDADYYRITEAGRAACPFRNPLAATVVAPAKQEINMPKENIVTRQDVLEAIAAAGPAGTTCKRLIEKFNCGDQVIYNHVSLLGKAAIPVIFKPEKGRIVAIQYNHLDAASGAAVPAHEKPVAEAKAQPAASPIAELKQDRIATAKADLKKALDQHVSYLMPAMAELAVKEETIEIGEIQDRRAPVLIDSPEITVFGIFSSGELEITEGFHCIKLTAPVVAKLRGFLGLFGEVA